MCVRVCVSLFYCNKINSVIGKIAGGHFTSPTMTPTINTPIVLNNIYHNTKRQNKIALFDKYNATISSIFQ